MTDIFLSYAHEDVERVNDLLRLLEEEAWSVWSDRKVPFGHYWDEEIERELTTATAVVVAWTSSSVESRWVHTEAAAGRERGVLVPVFLDDVSPPLEFRRLTGARLMAWKGNADDPEAQVLLDNLRRILSQSPSLDQVLEAPDHRPPEPDKTAPTDRLCIATEFLSNLSETDASDIVETLRSFGPSELARAYLYRDRDRPSHLRALRSLASVLDPRGYRGTLVRLLSAGFSTRNVASKDLEDSFDLPTAVPLLAAFLLDTETPSNLQKLAADCLSTADSDALPVCIELIGASRSERSEAVLQPFLTAGHDLIPVIATALSSESRTLRRGGAIAAGTVSDVRLRSPLEETKLDRDPITARGARLALRRIAQAHGPLAGFTPVETINFRILVGGSVGGKARAINYLMSVITRYSGDVGFRVPASVVIGTDDFEDALEKCGLAPLTNELELAEVLGRFESIPLSGHVLDQLCEALPLDQPLIARSSSLLEGSVGHSLAGLYHSVWIPGATTREHRQQQLERAVRKVQASVFTSDARSYRLKKGLEVRHEKMAVLIQPVVGRYRGQKFYPTAAGSAYSRNFFPWSGEIPLDAPVVRLVYGLGTSVVRREGASVFSPGYGLLADVARGPQEAMSLAQQHFDYLDLESGKVRSEPIGVMLTEDPDLEWIAEEPGAGKRNSSVTHQGRPVAVSFRKLLNSPAFGRYGATLGKVVKRIEDAFEDEVSLEFALELQRSGSHLTPAPDVSVLQVRPLDTWESNEAISLPSVDPRNTVLKSSLALGNTHLTGLQFIVWLSDTAIHGRRGWRAQADIRKANQRLRHDSYVLIGPGWWGTQIPGLGVPVTYADISNACAIVELIGSQPAEPSFGGHLITNLQADSTPLLSVGSNDYINRNWLSESSTYLQIGDLVKVIRVPGGLGVAVDGRSREGCVYRL